MAAMRTTAPPVAATDRPAATPPRDRLRTIGGPALAGAVAAGVAIAVAELIAGLIDGAPSLVLAIGALVIDLQPPGAKDLVANLFGTNDKLALNIVIILVALAVAAAVGIVGSRAIGRADTAFAVFGFLALFAALREPLVSAPLAIVTTVASVAAGIGVLHALIGRLAPRPVTVSPGPRPSSPAAEMPDWDRRRFLLGTAAAAGAAVVAGGIGRYLLQARAATATPTPAIPRIADAVAPLTPVESLAIPGITPIVMPNNDFYRIDTALLPPRLDAGTWGLTVKGMVDRTVTLDYRELTTMPLFEQYVTIGCVSNQVGGDLVGNALWSGVHLRDVLAMAGVQSGASQIVGRSADGWTAGFPTEWAMDPARDPMIALLMNGAPLPIEHGYPARLIVPGLYGYVSATKWLTEIELTTLEAFDGYWIPLGWAKLGPILTQSRIDVPRNGASIATGRTTIAGVAWAPDRGISRVEVSVDSGAWQPCLLSQAISKATWVQWESPWAATAGTHTIEVRATDGSGAVQTAQRSDPAPDGARGHHTIQVRAG
ncbi:MAG: molybdopterin-dependent oxidoreductase [Candidatus Limnocylindrales bacterium]